MDDGYVPQSPDLSALHHPPPPAPGSPSSSSAAAAAATHAHAAAAAIHAPHADPALAPFHAAPPAPDAAHHTRESFSLPASARPRWFDAPPPQPHALAAHAPSPPLSPPLPPAPAMATTTPEQPPLPVIKTKFPIARIKRIVQADEDVGKVAQATPVAVSKALEQFMISLARRSADEARARGSKKVAAVDMKAAVGKDEVFDFLTDIVDKIPDAPARGAAGRKDRSDAESDDDAAAAAAAAAPPPAAAGARRKKRAAPRRRKDDFDDD